MAVATFNSVGGIHSPGDGLVWSDTIQSWQTAHDNASGTYAASDDNPGNFLAGYSVGGENEILRSFFNFDISSLPAGAVITAAKFRFFTYSESNLTYGRSTVAGPLAFARLVEANPISTSQTTLADYSRVTTAALTEDLPFTSINLDDYTDINFNAAGLAYLASHSMVSLAARDGYDVSNSAYPANTNFQIWINFSENAIAGTADQQRFVADMIPQLVITYTVSSPSSSHSSSPSSSVSSSFSSSPSHSVSSSPSSSISSSESSSVSSSTSSSPSPSTPSTYTGTEKIVGSKRLGTRLYRRPNDRG